MDEVTRLLLLLVVAGVAVTVLAGIARWNGDERRRLRRGLKLVLEGDTHGFLPALGRGCGLGFNFTAGRVAVVWDQGAWGFVYSLDELIGAEVIIDGEVVGRVHRGEPRLALNAFDAEERVTLRLLFDDLSQPDFSLDLWLPDDEGRRYELPPPEAIAEANRWLARIEALLRRPQAHPRPAAVSPRPALPGPVAQPEPLPQPLPELGPDTSLELEPEPAPRSGKPAMPLFERLADEEDPPWAEVRRAQANDEDGEARHAEDDEEDEIRSLRL